MGVVIDLYPRWRVSLDVTGVLEYVDANGAPIGFVCAALTQWKWIADAGGVFLTGVADRTSLAKRAVEMVYAHRRRKKA